MLKKHGCIRVLAVLGLTVVCTAMGTIAPAAALQSSDIISVRTEVGKDSVRVGERLPIRVYVSYPDSLSLHAPSTLPEGKYRPVSFKWTQKTKGNELLAEAKIEIFTLDLKEAYLPSLHMLFTTPSGDTLSATTDAVHVPIRLVTNERSTLAPLKSQWEAPRSWLVPVLLALILVMACVGILLWRKLRKKPEQVEPLRPLLPPDFAALRKLARIEKLGLLDKGDFKQYYTLVIDAMRRYLEGRFAIAAMDRTTDEIMYALAAEHIEVNGLEEMLREGMLVKFAKFAPGIVPAKRLMETSRKIIGDTTFRNEAMTAAGESTVEN